MVVTSTSYLSVKRMVLLANSIVFVKVDKELARFCVDFPLKILCAYSKKTFFSKLEEKKTILLLVPFVMHYTVPPKTQLHRKFLNNP